MTALGLFPHAYAAGWDCQPAVDEAGVLLVPTRPHPAAIPVSELLKDCQVERTRRSGPGGQHRNKVETAVVLTHQPTGIQSSASERRSQAENYQVAVFRLRVTLAVEARQPVHIEGGPSDLWVSRCLGNRIRVNPEHDDFPALLAEALDWLAAMQWELNVVAEKLGCSASQLRKLIELKPRAFAVFNDQRVKAGLRPLKSS